ncbi:MAG: hypothetical protein AB7U73_25365 [Pirellulales bacterium]|uniref:hypothetical protein n=1 Tax=Bradyrhizobium sp. TaxID=376 RepID=UPI003D0B01E6
MSAGQRGHHCPHCGSSKLTHERDERITHGIARRWRCTACGVMCRSYDYVPGHGNAGTRQLVARYADQIAGMVDALRDAVGDGGVRREVRR